MDLETITYSTKKKLNSDNKLPPSLHTQTHTYKYQTTKEGHHPLVYLSFMYTCIHN